MDELDMNKEGLRGMMSSEFVGKKRKKGRENV